MFNKNDPLVQAVQGVMKENAFRRRVEEQLNEELGIASKKALPHEQHAEYDALLEQRLEEAGHVLPDLTQKKEEPKPSKEYAQRMKDDKDKKKSSENERARAAGLFKGSKKSTVKEALHPNQQKLDVHEPEKDKLTAQDFKMLRAKKAMSEEEGEETREGGAVVDTKTGKAVVSPTAPKASEGPSAEDKAALTKKIEAIKEEQINEVGDTPKGRRAINAIAHRADDEIAVQAMKSRPNKKKLNKALRAASLAFNTDERRGGKVLNSYIKSRYGLDEEQIDESDFYQKAQRKMIKNALNRKKSTEKPEPSFYQKAQSKMIKNALNRKKSTTNEEVEQLDEISKGKLAKESVDLSKIKMDKSTGKISSSDPKIDLSKISMNMSTGKLSNLKEKTQLDEKAVSKAQQKLFGIALATRRGETDKGSEAATKLAADMPEKELLKFAKTKRKGLPEKVKKIEEDIDSVMEEIRANLGEEAYAEIIEQIGGSPISPGYAGAAPGKLTPRPTTQAAPLFASKNLGGKVANPPSAMNVRPQTSSGSAADEPDSTDENPAGPTSFARRDVPDRVTPRTFTRPQPLPTGGLLPRPPAAAATTPPAAATTPPAASSAGSERAASGRDSGDERNNPQPPRNPSLQRRLQGAIKFADKLASDKASAREPAGVATTPQTTGGSTGSSTPSAAPRPAAPRPEPAEPAAPVAPAAPAAPAASPRPAAPRPAAPRPEPAAPAAPAADTSKPAEPLSRKMFQAAQDQGDDSPAAFFRADKQLSKERASMNESFDSFVRKFVNEKR